MTTLNDPLIGTVYDGRYRIERRIGAGGMANVYLAEDETLGRRVAIKILHQRYAEDSQFVERCLREASAAARLNHPNIVQVYDRGQAGGSYYIAMEYVDGMTLKDLVRRRGALTEQEVLAYGRQALHALRAAHRNGLVHRDVKPQNMMVDTDGRLKIADFGIARAAADADQGLTEAGSIVGTAQYLSPEQAQGHEVAAPSDLYSLGVVMYEMGTGRVPFDGDSPVNVALKHVKDPVTRPTQFNPALSVGLESIILKAMEKDPSLRYGSADEMLADLDRAREGTQTSAMTQVSPAIGATQVTPITPTPLVKPVPRPVGSRYDQQAVAPEPAFADRGGWDDDGDSRAERRSPWRWILPLVVLVALLVAAGAILLGGGGDDNKGDTKTTSDQVQVPSLTGGTQAAAIQKLDTAGLTLGTVTPEFDEEAPKGQVIDQDPGAGDEVADGSKVNLVISKGPAPIPVPDVTNMTLEEATAAFSEAKFTATPTTTEAPSDDVEEGHVIAQAPKAGGDAVPTVPIKLVISSGKDDIQVPNVIGLSSDAAKQQLRAAGFTNISTDQANSAEPRGEVIQQSPTQDTRAPKDQAITLTIATGTNDIPDTIGKSEAEAQGLVEDQGFVANFVTADGADPAQPLVVISSDPSNSATVGSTITLTLGQQPLE
ncbi:MAG: hypothetical protein JWN72_2283 [Thermoleophilia bacterium]|nr:hypothetical protein [Thermoleophilia bacterium]